MKRLGNGEGSVYKLAGRRSHPWAARKTIGFKENGQPKYKFIGYYRTKAEALHALMEYNKSPYSLNGEKLCDIFNRFIDAYKENKTENTVGAMMTKWRHMIPLHDMEITEITRRDLQIYFDSFDATEITKKKVKVALKQIFDYAVRYDIIPPERTAIFDYLDLSGNVDVNRKPHNMITEEEIEYLWRTNDDMSQFILFLIYTGLRCGEYQDVMENDDIIDNIIHVRRSKTRSGIREVPLSDKVLKLDNLPHFASYDNMKYRYKVWREKEKFEHKLHDTRHTCISLLTEAKIDERIIRAIVGHSGSSVTENVYTHISNEEKRAALNKI